MHRHRRVLGHVAEKSGRKRGSERGHLVGVLRADGEARHGRPVVQLPVRQVPPHQAAHEGLADGGAAPAGRLRHHPPRAQLPEVQVGRQTRDGPRVRELAAGLVALEAYAACDTQPVVPECRPKTRPCCLLHQALPWYGNDAGSCSQFYNSAKVTSSAAAADVPGRQYCCMSPWCREDAGGLKRKMPRS